MTKKRLLLSIFLILTVAGIAFYAVPLVHLTGLSRTVVASQFNVFRYLASDSLRDKCLPEGARLTDSGFALNGIEFIPGTLYRNGLNFTLKAGKLRFETRLLAFADGVNQVLLNWTTKSGQANNPNISRLRRNKIRSSMGEMLNSFGVFLENPDSVYGFHITRPPTTDDSLLVTTRRNFARSPTPAEIYAVLDTLQDFAQSQSIKKGKTPMMNLSADSGFYRLMVAWPVNRMGNNIGNMIFKQMIPHLFLRTEVTGGNVRVEQAIHALDLYMIDNKLTAVAIPFEYLETDRRKEPDSTRWRTILFYPCF